LFKPRFLATDFRFNCGVDNVKARVVAVNHKGSTAKFITTMVSNDSGAASANNFTVFNYDVVAAPRIKLGLVRVVTFNLVKHVFAVVGVVFIAKFKKVSNVEVVSDCVIGFKINFLVFHH